VSQASRRCIDPTGRGASIILLDDNVDNVMAHRKAEPVPSPVVFAVKKA
jgi:hypothetical protein